jgi:hypothetical protein
MFKFFDELKNAKWEHKPSGTILVDDTEVAHTLQCCHCNRHFVSVKGSGTRRGFCMRCMKATCGSQKCDVCVPFEVDLLRMERVSGV